MFTIYLLTFKAKYGIIFNYIEYIIIDYIGYYLYRSTKHLYK